MKAIYKIALLSFSVLAAACTDLDEKVYSDIQKKDFFTSEESLRIYAARAYNMLQAYGSEQSLWTLNIQVGDELAAPKNCVNDWVDTRYAELQRHTYSVSNKLVRMGWDYCFDGIAACNDVLYEIEQSSLEFEGKYKILAEVRLLRDYLYIQAIDGWGNVPFSVDASDTGYPVQKDREYVFEFVEREILDNIEYLEEVPSGANYGHVTQGMAYTLLAKMYLNAEKWIGKAMWAEAEKTCLAVMDAGHYRIEPDYSTNFAVNNEASRENIFVIPYSTIYTESDHNDFVLFILTLTQQLCKLSKIPAAGWA
ncbi:MAG: RagB/SusD family nutrient uptake outer membrane protein, partial [Alistipes sp.]|nr:RagB/SusD family nutrient uptake outer membrane protein [Alistipes sp.]